jgi:bifunctional DNA-binding transcriptional regulator/antitoxin component of YhaV-PrlF toxin-antitoxin module
MNVQSPFRSINMTSKGQVLIPKHVRERTGLVPGRPVRVGINEHGQAVILPCEQETEEGRRVRIADSIRSVAGSFATGRTTEEMMRELRGDEPFV